MKYKIEPELEAVCLPLVKEEYDLLESQIIRDGCLDPVKVWDRDGELVLLDGHNRLKICRENKLPEPISSTIEIESIDEAVIWIVDNQKGRRNVATEAQRNYISGKRYEAQKNINKFKGNQYTVGVRTDDAHQNLPYNGNRTSYLQGLEEDKGYRTIEKNAAFARNIDAIRKVSPDVAEKILNPAEDASVLSKIEVVAVSKIPPGELRGIVLQGVDAIKAKVKDIRELEKDRKFQAEQAAIKEDVAEYHAVHKEKYGDATYVCGLSSVHELWCNFCKCAFDVFKPHWGEVCPSCGSKDIITRDEMWYPGQKVD